MATQRIIPPQTQTFIYQLEFLIGNGTDVITTGVYPTAAVSCPRVGTLTSWTILSVDAASPTSGAIVIDVWKDTYANFPPVVGDSICGSGTKPTIAATNAKATGSDFTNYTTVALAAGDVIFPDIVSVTSLKAVKFILTYTTAP